MDLNVQEDKDLDGLIMDEQLNKLYQAFNDYKKERSLDYIDPGDFIDNYLFENNNINATNYDYLHSNAQSTITQISKDFETFESTELAPIEFNNNIDPLITISKDFESTDSIREMPIEYNNNSSGPVIRYFFCGQTKNVLKPKNNGRKRQTRKYRGVVMSEEQRLIKLAQQKIKNREVAAKAHEMRMAREAHLVSLHAELLKKNDLLKKMVMFPEDHKRVDVPPKPLRRTISVPTLIQEQ